MKKQFLPAVLAGAVVLGAFASGRRNSDPVVMTVNGKSVTQSEFEYLYKKNNLQQETALPVSEYLDMFVVYKLKVADAEAAGIDTTAAFVKELDGYCADISAPYLVDTLVRDRLVNEAWQRMQTVREVSHIMLPKGRTSADDAKYRARLDSIRSAIMAGADFADMADKYSIDRPSAARGGSVGFIASGRYPYPFEKVVWDTPVGQVSEVFDDTPYGWHIVKVTAEKPHPGFVTASHILKYTQGADAAEDSLKKQDIDSIFNLLCNGADFAQMAVRESEDPGSAQNGGRLGKFGPGMMMPEFEEQAYGLPDGAMSHPFHTSYGWHILLVDKHLPLGTLAENRKDILVSMSRDNRALMPRRARMDELQERWGFKVNQNGMDAVRAQMESAPKSTSGRRASAAVAAVDPAIVVATLPDGSAITAGQVIAEIPESALERNYNPYATFERQAREVLDNAIIRHGRTEFAKEDADFRNLVNEYRDGILLFEASNRRVWNPSNHDAEALARCFEQNRANYTWDKPRYKGYVVLATSDSVAAAARSFLVNNKVERDSLVKTLAGLFGPDVKIERVLTAKGDNKIVDEVAFGGDKAPAVGKWCAWFTYDGKVLEQPEEASDVKALVSADLQQQLEKEWVNELRAKYKVKINDKAIRKIKI